MPVISGGEAAYQALLKLGVTHVFGIPSVHNIPVFDAIGQGGAITPVIVRHEQAAVHSADGYARATGRLGVVLGLAGHHDTALIACEADAVRPVVGHRGCPLTRTRGTQGDRTRHAP